MKEIVAHELGHGAFSLRHTFSPDAFIYEEGKTQNLMDYGGDTDLWHHQWQEIHNPNKLLFGWAQDEEEGALIDKNTKILITLNKINDDFIPGKNDLCVEYYIENLENLADIHKNITKAFIWILKNDEIVYAEDLPLKNSYVFKWNGKCNRTEIETDIHNLSDFTIKIGVTIKYEHSFKNIIEWLFTKDVDFQLFSAIEKEWSVEKWKKDYESFEHKYNMQYVNEDKYKSHKEKYKDRLEMLGVNTVEVTPIEYLNEHLVNGDFLGKEIPSINIRFLYFLRKLEEELGRGKKWDQNSSMFNNYCFLAPNIEDYARMSDVGESLSDHATGFAFDFEKDKNPWFTSTKNKYQDKFIEIVTGKKVLNYVYNVFSGNGADEIKQANDDFIKRIKENNINNNNFEELKNAYDKISDYSYKISLKDIDNSTKYNNKVLDALAIIEGFVINDENVLENELNEQKRDFVKELEDIINSFKDYKMDIDNLKLLFDVSKRGLFINYDMGDNYQELYSFIMDYNTKFNSIITSLESVNLLSTYSIDLWNSGINRLIEDLLYISFNANYQNVLTQFVVQFNKKMDILNDVEIDKFPEKLKNETENRRSYEGGNLFENGFCNIDASLVKAISLTQITINNEKMRLLWGGSYNKTKDFMHFELRKQAQSKDRPWQKIVHEIDIVDIKNYLNSFDKKNGGKYDY